MSRPTNIRLFAVGSVAHEEQVLAERLALMGSSALFAGLSSSERFSIASKGRTRSFVRNEALFVQGHPVHSLMLIQHGSVKLTQASCTRHEVILYTVSDFDVIGLYPGNYSSLHTCSAQALDPCLVVIWDYPRFSAFMDEYPILRTNVNSILSARLQDLEQRFREVATECVAKRLALSLLHLTKQIGRPHGAGTQIAVSREELAQHAGTTVFTASRMLSEWDEAGLIMARRQVVIITNRQHLEDLANGC
jgi:CRP-like cAMP-binding protein